LTENKEIEALFKLIDDPDEDVYHTVSEKIISFGKGIIPNLENYWEHVRNEEIQERIELLIHRLHFRDLTQEFTEWANGQADLLNGSIIISKYHYPDMQPAQVRQLIEKIRRNIWLELNNYLTPIEKINVFNSIFFNYFKHTGVEIGYDNPEYFLINKTLESKKGNAISNGILYQCLCYLLDIPVKAIHIPRQYILGFFDEQYEVLNPSGHSSEKILFYIDPINGQMYSHKDIENYFKRISVPPTASYFRPLSNKRIIQQLLTELSKCFDNENNQYKMNELLSLAQILDQ
jgi:regulator of sirC expression with transglutaminase-like and TPR domain